MDAVNQAPKLVIEMLQSPEQWNVINQQFKRESAHEITAVCLGCLDGFFQYTNKFMKGEVVNVSRIAPVTMNNMG